LLLAGWAASGEAPPSQLRLAGEGVEALAALGASADDVDGFRRSHREAMHARRMARLLRRRPGSVTRYGDVSLLALASTDLDHARTFAADQLGALAADDDDTVRLAATLRVYLEEHASPRRAAQRLGLHENTIKNRIRAAQELLPHPIDGHVAELLVALRLTRAVSGRLGPEPGATRR
jgi:DNA-binding PucR family transcriptional regulator